MFWIFVTDGILRKFNAEQVQKVKHFTYLHDQCHANQNSLNAIQQRYKPLPTK
jgi:hypothetical protein